MRFVAMLVPAVAVCSDDESLAPVVYHGSVSVASQRKAYVELVTGEVKRHRIDEDILPHWMTKGSWESRHPNLTGTFGAEDEEQFVQSFIIELVHSGLFKQAVETRLVKTVAASSYIVSISTAVSGTALRILRAVALSRSIRASRASRSTPETGLMARLSDQAASPTGVMQVSLSRRNDSLTHQTTQTFHPLF